jgi:hypothetical protein
MRSPDDDVVSHEEFRYLADLVDGLVAGAGQTEHPMTNRARPEVASAYSWLRRCHRALAASRAARPDHRLHSALLAQFDQGSRAAERMDASVTFDSATSPLAPGLRAGRLLEERHLNYSAGGVEVILDMGPSPFDSDRFDLHGQLLADDDAFAVQLLHQDREVALVGCDAVGEFEFVDLGPGVYELVVAGPGTEIALGTVKVG